MKLSDIHKAKKLLKAYVQETPLIHVRMLDDHFQHGARFFLKCEHLQVTNSFKTRGAFNVLLHLSEKEKKRGVITRSAGNFGKALAFAGQTLNIPVTIVMSPRAPVVKKEGVKKYGAKLILQGTKHDEIQAKVEELAKEEGLLALSPFDHRDVIIGAGTIGLEIKEQLPSITHYIGPIGGGGLMSGSAFALKELDSKVQTLGVEPSGANDYFLSCQKGKKITIDNPHSIADGLLAPTVGDLNWPLLQSYVDKPLLVSEKEIIGAMRFLYRKLGMIVEPSGAVSVAAYLFHPELSLKGDIVAVVSGGNVDRDKFYNWIHQPS